MYIQTQVIYSSLLVSLLDVRPSAVSSDISTIPDGACYDQVEVSV